MLNPDKDWPYERECPVCNEKPHKEPDLPSALKDPQGKDLYKEMEQASTTPPARSMQVQGSHYKKYPIQPYEYNQRNGLRYCEGNVVKYVTRHRDKGGKQDILKAIHYLQLLLEEEYKDENN